MAVGHAYAAVNNLRSSCSEVLSELFFRQEESFVLKVILRLIGF